MTNIDKEKFGAFLAQLRKEQGLTQKDLAGKLFLSDKAISKWERGQSLPDISSLLPLADLLGVTASELLQARRCEEASPMAAEDVESLVKKALVFSEDSAAPSRHSGGWILSYCSAVALAGTGIFLLYFLGCPLVEIVNYSLLFSGLLLFFGGYFCFFAQEKLPHYYDENQISIYSHGAFRMNVPGVRFNNSNWPPILRSIRLSCLWGGALFPWLYLLLYLWVSPRFPEMWHLVPLLVFLPATFLLLFLPIWIMGRKYQ